MRVAVGLSGGGRLQRRRVAGHRGYWHFTIGQRRGLGLPGGEPPYYVVRIDAKRNEVVVGRRSLVASG